MGLSGQSKGKYQPWSHEEFMADRRVSRMTSSARKIYMVLLHEAFVCSTRPDLPDDDEELAIMADCDDPKEWETSRSAVLAMFNRDLADGTPVLFRKRLREDWTHLQEIRESKADAGRASAEARRKLKEAKQNSTDVNTCSALVNKEVSKEVSKEREVSEEKEEISDPDSEIPLNGQEDQMNLKNFKTEMAAKGAKYGFKVSGYQQTWEDLIILTKAHSSQAVINDFDGFLSENRGAEFNNVLIKYLYVAADRLLGEAPALAEVKSPALTNLNRELTYLSGGVISFIDKQKIKLAELLHEWSEEEIIAVFKEWLSEQDLNDPKNVQYLPGKFVQTADSRCYALRRSRAEKVSEGLARQRAVERLQEAAIVESREAERKRKEEEEQFNPIADLMS
jgi:uncharacterized protein YdaU (DUF1376 family)